MKPKYEKPITRDLGDSLQNAKGICIGFGSTATGVPGENCGNGSVARGARCLDGDYNTGPGCNTGQIPEDLGCVPGFHATPACQSGTSG